MGKKGKGMQPGFQINLLVDPVSRPPSHAPARFRADVLCSDFTRGPLCFNLRRPNVVRSIVARRTALDKPQTTFPPPRPTRTVTTSKKPAVDPST